MENVPIEQCVSLLDPLWVCELWDDLLRLLLQRKILVGGAEHRDRWSLAWRVRHATPSMDSSSEGSEVSDTVLTMIFLGCVESGPKHQYSRIRLKNYY